VPLAATTLVQVPEGPSDEQLLFLGDILPTGWQAAAQCDIQPTDTVAVWGCGPGRSFHGAERRLQGAKTVIAIDDVPERLELARQAGAHVVIDRGEENVLARLNDLTSGEGPEKVIDAVGWRRTDPTGCWTWSTG
jgi:threonine dehydrogenase-like Zn-dependent dehydrogenase